MTPDAARFLRNVPQSPLQGSQPMLRLSPSRDTQKLAQTHRLLDGGPDRVPQQTQVRRIFDIRLHHEAVAPCLQPHVHRMTDGLMPELNDRVVDLRQDIVVQKGNGVRQRRCGNGCGIQDIGQTRQTA